MLASWRVTRGKAAAGRMAWRAALRLIVLAGCGTAVVHAPALAQGLPSWTQKLASNVRLLDFRNGVPDALARRGFTPGALVQLANPYLPADRRVLVEAKSMACHPQGGVVLWARMLRFDSAKAWTDINSMDIGVGAYRVEGDGRVTPFAAQDQRDLRNGKQLCGTPVDQVFLPDWTYVQQIAVEPSGDVLLASGASQAVLRFTRGGRVERVAGGGEGLCSIYPYDGGEAGHRDGAAAQALFKGTMSLTLAPDGSIYVAEGGWLPSGGGASEGNCSIRRIGTDGRVSTVFGNGQCDKDSKRVMKAAMSSVAIERIVAERGGQLVVVGMTPGQTPDGYNAAFSKAFRIDPTTGKAQAVAYAAWGAGLPKGWPGGRFNQALGLTPEGVAMAFNDMPRSASTQPGLMRLDAGEPTTPRPFWKVSAGGWIDGPAPGISAVNEVCSATDGTVFFLQKDALRRLDPKTGVMTTWLH